MREEAHLIFIVILFALRLDKKYLELIAFTAYAILELEISKYHVFIANSSLYTNDVLYCWCCLESIALSSLDAFYFNLG